jgi:hypothetical protein
MATTAEIGFHAAYNADTGQETGVGNALVGAYLARIGLSDAAVVYITQAAPKSMTWLSVAEANKRGIGVVALGPPAAAPTNPAVADAARSVVSPISLEQRASNFISSLFAGWSSPNAQPLQALETLYADEVTYYGKVLSRDAVLDDKRRFVVRWPQRLYTIRSGTLLTQCDSGSLRCTVSGTVDWAAAKDAKRSTGVASFSYTLAPAGTALKIAEETSKAVQGPFISTNVPDNSHPQQPLAARWQPVGLRCRSSCVQTMASRMVMTGGYMVVALEGATLFERAFPCQME